jgi:hypothetical protein
MKKQLFTIALIITTAIASAQTVTYGVKAGINLANQSLRNAGFSSGSKNLFAFNLGLIADIDKGSFAIQPGLFFTTKGEQFKSSMAYASGASAGDLTTKYILNYIEVPVNFLYKVSMDQSSSLHFGGGPYFAYGLSAKISSGGTDYRGSFGNNPNDAIYYKNPDYGLNFVAGATVGRYIVDLQYGLGLANLAYSSATLQNRVISFSVGYLFK